MGKVEQLEKQIETLSEKELAAFREWFTEFDWQAWDRQIERDAGAGRLDTLADKALREHAKGKTKPL